MNKPDNFVGKLLNPELLLGMTSLISSQRIGVNLYEAGRPSGTYYLGHRYGRGEVGEFVLVEGQQDLVLGRVTEIRLREPERLAIGKSFVGDTDLSAIGYIQLLGHISTDSLRVHSGVEWYPRIGDRVYSAPQDFIAALPRLMETESDQKSVEIAIGNVGSAGNTKVYIRPERLFGRHCAILGATGGGKSWTTASILEECSRYKSKMILIDATGEYSGFNGEFIKNCHLGSPIVEANQSENCSLPPTSFLEPDFLALFEPAGKVQGPKLRAAMRSLRLAQRQPELAAQGYIRKINRYKVDIEAAENDPAVAPRLENPNEPFDVRKLVQQIEQECVYPEGFAANGPRGAKDPTIWGGESGDFSYCLSLVSRINGVLNSPAFSCVFRDDEAPRLTDAVNNFVQGTDRLLRICLSGIAFEYNAREIIANVIGRHLLRKARQGDFKESPVVVFVDEAHNFLGRRIGSDDNAAKLDAFELIAKEGRKYGLNICLASQRPRDITEGVLSQIGTLIVHRLTNDRDREVVERASGEMDRDVTSFLPNLQPGEAVIIGTDFPIPLTTRIDQPSTKPVSHGPQFQKHWSLSDEGE